MVVPHDGGTRAARQLATAERWPDLGRPGGSARLHRPSRDACRRAAVPRTRVHPSRHSRRSLCFAIHQSLVIRQACKSFHLCALSDSDTSRLETWMGYRPSIYVLNSNQLVLC